MPHIVVSFVFPPRNLPYIPQNPSSIKLVQFRESVAPSHPKIIDSTSDFYMLLKGKTKSRNPSPMSRAFPRRKQQLHLSTISDNPRALEQNRVESAYDAYKNLPFPCHSHSERCCSHLDTQSPRSSSARNTLHSGSVFIACTGSSTETILALSQLPMRVRY